ncbi:MAG TPA: hypothetical protein VFQ75_15240 [Candidatus Limnocylindrales bacterium]|nr:hypothetical protein [Candidatus Limnocylindrales bacterium]
MAPAPVTVLILAPAPDPGAGPLVRLLDEARTALAGRHREAFLAAGATSAVFRREPADETPFGARLRAFLGELGAGPGGLVVLGAGSIPLATPGDLEDLIQAAGAGAPGALANSFFSADAIAVACAAETLRDLPADLAGDNALPRWLAEIAGIEVRDMRDRRDLAVDVDSPLDLLLIANAVPGLPVPADAAAVRARIDAVRAVAADPAAELLVAGRIAAADLARIERGTRARTRALVEERGLRTASLAAARGRPNRRPPRSLLGDLLDRDGPAGLGTWAARFSDGALVDTRVLLAARLGADERAWPAPEDRHASDLLLPDAVADPWLRELTASALAAPVPVLLGGHTLVGPGSPLALGIDG